MDHPRKLASIRAWSRFMRHACWALGLLLVIATAAHWLGLDERGLSVELGLRAVNLAPWRRLVGLGLVLTPVLVLAWGLWRLRDAFARFATGDVFSPLATASLRDFAAAATVSAATAMLVTPMLSFILTTGLPGGTQTTVAIGSGQLTILLVAGVVWVFANILAAAQGLAEENAALDAERSALADENAQFV